MTKKDFPPLVYSKRKIDREQYRDAEALGKIYGLVGPNNVLLQLNYACYLQCEMCERHEWIKEGVNLSDVLSTEEIFNLIEQLAKLKTQRITIVGTEPVMRKDLAQILREIRIRNIKPEHPYNSLSDFDFLTKIRVLDNKKDNF